MDRYEFSDEQLAEIRARVPEFDPERFSTFAQEFEAAIRSVAERDGGATAAILRLTLPQAFGLGKTEKVTVDDAARQTGIESEAALAIMQNAVAEAGEIAHQRAP